MQYSLKNLLWAITQNAKPRWWFKEAAAYESLNHYGWVKILPYKHKVTEESTEETFPHFKCFAHVKSWLWEWKIQYSSLIDAVTASYYLIFVQLFVHWSLRESSYDKGGMKILKLEAWNFSSPLAGGSIF